LSDLQVFIERRERVRALEGASTRFERELYHQHMEKFYEIESDMESSTFKLRELLTSEFLAQQHTSSYGVIKDFLQSVEEACQGDVVQTLLEPATVDTNDIVSALEQLLRPQG